MQSILNDEFLTPDQVCELIPTMITEQLAQHRYHGSGPAFYKPSGKRVLYKRSDVEEWFESTRQTTTKHRKFRKSDGE